MPTGNKTFAADSGGRGMPTRQHEAADAIEHHCEDPLTGLYSKEAFFQKAHRQMQVRPDRKYVIICSDVENFKLFNDAFGYAEGDQLLKSIEEALRKLAGDTGICGRMGADRFMLLLSRRERPEDYARLMESMDESLPAYSGKLVKWGIYEVIDPVIPVEQMCDHALMAKDSIKGQYNTRFALYDDALRDKLLREQRMIASLGEAVQAKQLAVYLQPKFALADNSLAGAEALVRWIHPELGFLSPGEFVPLLERKGFISQLDRYMWEQACALLHDWQARGLKSVPISVNVSRADIYQPEFPDVLPALVEKYQVDSKMLHLEITESAYAEDTEQIIEAVDRLRTWGFCVEMDDFGSGYSSLNMLSRVKMDVLKLDMKFVQTEVTNAGERGILPLVVEMAKKMDMRVVAEGVETPEQLQYVRDAGCDYVQGFLFAKPMPSAEFEKYL